MENNKTLRHAAISVGRRLKEARENKSISIEQIQRQTKIHSSVIKALEEGTAGSLLSETYIKSFIRKYSQALGLNAAELIKEYYPPDTGPAAVNTQLREQILPPEAKLPPKFLYFTGLVAGGLVILALVFLAGKGIASRIAKSKASRVRVSRAAPAVKKSNAVSKRSAKQKSSSESKSGPRYLVPLSQPLNLVIRVKESVLVKLKKDGILLYERVLSKGTVETVTAKKTIDIDIGKPKALDLTLNGRPIVFPPKGKIYGLLITHKGVRIK